MLYDIFLYFRGKADLLKNERRRKTEITLREGDENF